MNPRYLIALCLSFFVFGLSAQAKDRVLQGATVQIYTGPISEKPNGPVPPEIVAFWKPFNVALKDKVGRALAELHIERLDLDKPVVYSPPPVPKRIWDQFSLNKDPLLFRERFLALVEDSPVKDTELFGNWTQSESKSISPIYERNLLAKLSGSPDCPIVAFDPNLSSKQGEVSIAGQKVVAFKGVEDVRTEISRLMGLDLEADLAAKRDPFKQKHVYVVAWLGGRSVVTIPKLMVQPEPPKQTPPPKPATKTILRFSGSNTVGGKLLPALAVSYLQKEGCINVRKISREKEDESDVVGDQNGEQIQIEIRSHGTATAFEDLGSGTCEIGMASRKIKANEREALLPRFGDLTANSSEHVVALDGIAVVVHPSNPVKSLSVDQLSRLFSGDLNDWSQVGGVPGSVKVYARDGKSGTWDFFNDVVLKSRGRTLKSDATRLEDSNRLSESISTDANSIGFIGLNYVKDSKVLSISDQGVPARKPTLITVKTLDYLFSRQLYLYTSSTSSNLNVRKFVEHALGEEGQSVVESVGLINLKLDPLPSADDSDPRSDSAEWKKITAGATEIPTRYRFRTGSSELDSKGQRDIGRILGLLSQPKYRGKKITLIGFADAAGSAGTNRELSAKRATIIKDELSVEGLTVSELVGLGAQAFVAPNDTPENKERNRRVELWLK